MKKIIFLFKYISYLLKSKTKHGVHSPFVFSLVTQVIEDKSSNTIYDRIENIRKDLLNRNEEITVTDLGAGSTFNSSKKRKVKDIAKNTAKPPIYAQLLFRLVNHFKPSVMLELGTSLGISSMYQAMGNPKGKLFTIEGCPETAKIAQQNFQKIELKNIEAIAGNFDEQLPKILNRINMLDYVFFDGNHRKEPTINYFEQCLQLAHNNSLFIFDDIHWSDEMEEAWEIIKAQPKVSVTIDLFFMGLVFFRKEQAKQDFIISY